MTEFIKISSDMVQYTIDNTQSINESFASLLLNPYVTWAKFILTDDEPNGNKVRIPKEEFSNLIDSGLYMPIKMTLGEVGGHKASIPIGVITHLQENKNRIEGLAALWNSERPEDIGLLKEMYDNDEKLNISWEVAYSATSDSEKYEGVTDLLETVLKAATLVQTPAYEGRTTILALAEMEKKDMDELKERVEELEKSLAELQDEKQELLEKLDGQKATVEELTSQISNMEDYEDLKAFKDEIEAEKERKERLVSIKEKFEEAGIKKSDEYFEENSETLLGLEEASLGFLIQEMVAFGKSVEEAEEEEQEAEAEQEELPPILGKEGELDIKTLAEILKSGKEK